MTSTLPSNANPNPAQSASGASATASARSSYANATKSKPTAAQFSTQPAIAGGPSQHAKANTASPVNGKSNSPSAGAPPIVSSGSITNGSSSAPGQDSKPVTISAQGTSGYLPNGANNAQAVRQDLRFGSMNAASGSPAVAYSVPHNSHNPNLSTPMASSGTGRSPSPIPQPTVSGGRPPSAPQGQGGQLNFGSLGGPEGLENNMRNTPLPTGPANLNQSAHLRRDSNQSQQNDFSAMNRNFVQGNGRGRGHNPQYQSSNSPYSARASPVPPQNRNMVNAPAFHPGRQGGMNNSYNRSPAQAPVSMHGYQQQMNGQPPMHHQYAPQHGQYIPNQGMYVAQQSDYYGYYNQQYMQQPGMPGMQYPPPSPRPHNASQSHHAAFMPSPYMQPPNMSRTSSAHGSERPSSTAPSQLPTPSVNANQPPPVVSSSPAPHSKPERPKTKGIVIKNPDGEVIDFKAKLASNSPAPVQARAPPVVSSGAGIPTISTPPPRSATETPQSRPDTQVAKSSEEIKRQFTEQFKQNLQKAGKPEDDKSVDEEKAAPAPEVKSVEAPVETTEEATKAESSSAVDAAEEARKKQEEEDAWIAELEEQERLEEEREAKYNAEKKKKAEAAAAAAAAKLDEDLKRAEREAEALEEAKSKSKGDEESDEAKAEREKLFGALKKSTLGPGANASETPSPSESMPPPPAPSSAATTPTSKGPIVSRSKPSQLKIETGKSVEPAQPTAGMQSLRSARFIKLQQEDNIYPEGIQSPNPALNNGGKSRGRQYDKDFLMQFQEVFKEKPSVEWDKILKETVGDGSDSARPSSARAPSMGGRQNSRSGGPGPMGQFGAVPRTLAPGSTSEQRFAASGVAGARMGSNQPINPLAQFAHVGRGGIGGFSMGGATPMSRTGSAQSRGAHNINAARTNSGRNNSSRRVGGPQEAQMAKTMPLTAGKDLKPLQVSQSGWKPISIGVAPVAVPTGNLTPDVVQRKVKSALNKMTPEKFVKISEDILQIAGQSREESDGRTLRQVIQLTFEKACDEAHWASMYARFCKRMLETMSHDIKDENVKDKNGNPVLGGALFRKYLLNRCQEEFERGWEINLPDKKEGETEEAAMLSEEYYKAAAAKRRGLGLIQFIGELYKLGMLTMRIMHECVFKLLNFTGVPEESTVESLVKLLRTIGATMDSAAPNGKDMVNVYFDRVQTLMTTDGIPSRMYFMLLDIVDLRTKGWETKEADKGPKTITEIHEEAARKAAAADLERQRSQRSGGGRPQAGRGDARSFSGQPPPDYNRNTVGMDDLRRLARGGRSGASSGQTLGPAGGLMGSRNSSRRGLGPPSDGPSSRTGTPPVEKKESVTSVNAFSVLADNADGENDVASPPSTSVSPALSRSVPTTQSTDDTEA